MTKKLEGKVGVVTGAAVGIGRATAALFAQEGAKVAIVDIDEDKSQETLSLVKGKGGEGVVFNADVSQADQVRRMVEETVKSFGRLDALVNAAARQETAPPLVEVTEKEWDLVMGVNVKGPFLCCKYAIPIMLRTGGGSIVNIASSVVLRGSTFSLPYSVSKAGVVQLTKTASNQYAPRGIRVNCVIPGLVDSPASRRVDTRGTADFSEYIKYIPVGRVGQPEDIAPLILYLASDESSYVSGSCFVIDGGRSAH